MSNWPKYALLYFHDDGLWTEDQLKQVERDAQMIASKMRPLPVADQAPEPVARLLHRTKPLTREWGPNTVARTFEEFPLAVSKQEKYWGEGPALYLAPPSESAIRASERKRCAKFVRSLGNAVLHTGRFDEIAAAIEGLGDE